MERLEFIGRTATEWRELLDAINHFRGFAESEGILDEDADDIVLPLIDELRSRFGENG